MVFLILSCNFIGQNKKMESKNKIGFFGVVGLLSAVVFLLGAI